MRGAGRGLPKHCPDGDDRRGSENSSSTGSVAKAREGAPAPEAQ